MTQGTPRWTYALTISSDIREGRGSLAMIYRRTTYRPARSRAPPRRGLADLSSIGVATHAYIAHAPLGPPGARYLSLLALPGARYLSLLALPGARYLSLLALPGARYLSLLALPGARYLSLLALPGARYLSLLALLGARYLWRLTVSTAPLFAKKKRYSSSAFRYLIFTPLSPVESRFPQ